MKKFLSLFLAIFLINSCTAQFSKNGQTNSGSITSEKEFVRNITIEEGKTFRVPDTDLIITFKKITADSRCPEGVQCIWAGAATAEIEIGEEKSKPRIFLLSTLDMPSKNLESSAIYGGYTFFLSKVSNPKSAGKRHYTISIEIVKLTETKPEMVESTKQ